MSWSEIALRLALAIIIGGAVGYEREFRHRTAGFRTNILVCVGACVVSMIQVQSTDEILIMVENSPAFQNAFKIDVGRMGAQVISGIGFLGAGAILHEKGSVKGLTTAASLWVVACIGLAIGLGYYYLAIISAVSVVIVLGFLKKFEDKFLYKHKVIKLEIKYKKREDMSERLLSLFQAKNIRIKSIEFPVEDNEEIAYIISFYTILVPKFINIEQVISELSGQEEIIMVNIRD